MRPEGGCETILYGNRSDNKNLQFERMDSNLIQALQAPTGKEKESKSILDLIYINDNSLFSKIEISPSSVPDHLIEICTNSNFRNQNVTGNKIEEDEIRSIIFFN